jgi:hypothetical protein
VPERLPRRRARIGGRLPYAHRAKIAPEKLRDYCLKPDEGGEDTSGGKAKGFAGLGIYRDDWLYLHDELLKALPHAEVTHVDISTPARTYFTITIWITGRNGKRAPVRTGWCVDAAHEPWLTTCYVRREPRPKAPE